MSEERLLTSILWKDEHTAQAGWAASQPQEGRGDELRKSISYCAAAVMKTP